jgi:hypothetical protein
MLLHHNSLISSFNEHSLKKIINLTTQMFLKSRDNTKLHNTRGSILIG